MLRYECDNCRRLKQTDEEWILGFAAENIGARAARREITLLPRWDDARAVDWLAVHFCSESCREDYMQRLFARTPASGVVTEVEVLPITKRHIRTASGAQAVAGRKTIPSVAAHHKPKKRKHA